MVEPGAGGGGARRPMIVREPPPAGVNAFAEVGRGLNLAREKLAQQMNRKVLGVVVGDVAIGAAGGAAAKIALDMVFGIAGGPLGGAAAGAIKGSIGEWLKQSKEIAASGDRLSFKENLKRHNGGRIALAAGRGAIIGAVGGAVGGYIIEEISQTEWGQQAGQQARKFIADRVGEFARTTSTQNLIQKGVAFAKETLPFLKGAPSSAPGLLEPGQLPTAPAVPVEIPPAAPAPEVDTPLPPSPTDPGEVLLPPPAIVEPPSSVAAPPEFKPLDIQTDQVADQVEPLPATVAPNGAEVQGSVIDNSLTYNGKPWVLLENGTKNIGHLFQSVGEEGSTINEQVMATRLQEAADLWAHGQLTSSSYPDLNRLFHLSNGTKSVYNSLLNENTVVSLRNLGIVS